MWYWFAVTTNICVWNTILQTVLFWMILFFVVTFIVCFFLVWLGFLWVFLMQWFYPMIFFSVLQVSAFLLWITFHPHLYCWLPLPFGWPSFLLFFFFLFFSFFFFLHRVQVGDSLFSQWLLPNSPRPSFRHLKASLGNLPALRRGLHSLSKHSPSLNKRWNIEHTLQGWEFIIYYYFGAKMV